MLVKHHCRKHIKKPYCYCYKKVFVLSSIFLGFNSQNDKLHLIHKSCNVNEYLEIKLALTFHKQYFFYRAFRITTTDDSSAENVALSIRQCSHTVSFPNTILIIFESSFTIKIKSDNLNE